MKLGVEVGHGHIVLDGDPAPSPPKKGTAPQFSAHVCCGQRAGWIKMPLGRQVDFGPGDIMLDGDQLPQSGIATAPNLWPMSVVVKRLDGSRCHMDGDSPRPVRHCTHPITFSRINKLSKLCPLTVIVHCFQHQIFMS